MWVKICGIRDVETARAISDLRPDAIGLNFYSQSPRSVDVRMAERIARALPVDVEPIGVFVNHDPEEIATICRHVRISTVQLHGDESPEVATALQQQGFQVIRALRIDAANVDTLPATMEAHSGSLRAVLVDARTSGQYGGTGHTAPWTLLAAHWRPDWPPLILAGGLTPENVGEAIGRLHPWGVDTASGVESSVGMKDPALAKQFIASARNP